MTDSSYDQLRQIGKFFGLPILISKYLPKDTVYVVPGASPFLPELNEDEWRIPWEPDSLSYRLRRDLALRLYAAERRLGLKHDPGMEDRLFPRASFRSHLRIMQEEQLALLVCRPNPRGIAVISSVHLA